MKSFFTPKGITKIALVAGLYVAISYAFAPLASGDVQFRIAEALNLLALFNPIYIAAVTLGCAITNLLTSPLGLIDVFVGSMATLAATWLIYLTRKNIWVASLFPLINGPIVALELSLLEGAPFLLTMGSICFSEFIIVTVIGVPLFLLLMKNKAFVTLLTDRV